jgi:hypothetical protein
MFLGTIEDALPPRSSALSVGEGEVVGRMIGVRSSDAIVRTEVRRPLSENQTKQVREAFAKRKGCA